MKTKLLFTSLFILLSMEQVFAAQTIKHPTCNIVVANGPYYGKAFNNQMPKDYDDALITLLEEKGFHVIDQVAIGTYVDHSYVYQIATNENAMAMIHRDGFSVIPREDELDEYSCYMSFNLWNGHTSKEYDKQTSWAKLLPTPRMQCNALFRDMKKSIPDCKATEKK